MINYILIVLFVAAGFSLTGQSILQGKVIDSLTNQPISYVNIGVLGENVGTVTNRNGEFSLNIRDEESNSSIRISMVGYESKTFTISDFRNILKKNGQVYMSEIVYDMEDIVVKAKKFKGKKIREKVVGNSIEYEGSRIGFETNQLGNEIGIVVKIKNRPTLIQDLSVYIADNEFDGFKFRVNIYNLNNGLPDSSILKENIIVESEIKQGKLTVDLSQYDIIVEDDFFVSIEWIEDMGDYGLSFAVDISGSASPSIVRATSQGEWKEVGRLAYGAGIGIALTIRY